MAIKELKVNKMPSDSSVLRLVRNDRFTQIIRFKIPRYEGGVDLSSLVWAVNIINANEDTDVSYLGKGTFDDKYIYTDWTIGSVATAVAGTTIFELQGASPSTSSSSSTTTSSTQSLVWQSGRRTIEVSEDVDASPSVDPEELTEVQELLINVGYKITNFETRINNTEDLYNTIKASYERGDFKGAKGDTGAAGSNGVSPTISITDIVQNNKVKGYKVSITDVNGSRYFNVIDGVDGINGINGTNGTNGIDGTSPTISISNIDNGHKITIVDIDGTKTFNVINGIDGRDGRDGVDGINGVDGYTPIKGVDYFDGTNGIDGVDGVDGINGIDGYTPVKGVDYYTETEKQDLISSISNDVVSINNSSSSSSKINIDTTQSITEIDIPDRSEIISGIKVNGVSISPDSDRIVNIPKATSDGTIEGVVKVLSTNPLNGIRIGNDYALAINPASESRIDSRSGTMAIIPEKLNYAVKAALTDANRVSLSESEMGIACDTIGAARRMSDGWTLKGTITTDNKATGVTVDLTGCTELLIRAVTTGSSATTLKCSFGSLVDNISNTSGLTTVGYWSDTPIGVMCISCKNIGSADIAYAYGNGYGYSWVDGHTVSDITRFFFGTPSNITTCDIKIYAR